jgi:hypothetical protein
MVIWRNELRAKFWSENSLKLCALDLSGLEDGSVVWSCEYGKAPLRYVQCGRFLDWLNDSQQGTCSWNC